MNNQTGPTLPGRNARILFALLMTIFLVPAVRAQPMTEQSVDSRFLFIFDMSADMKKRVPAVQKALATILATSMSGQLHSGDSMGVWTFDQDLHAGKFPLQHWESADAVMIASNITTFISKQHYAKKASFDVLQSSLTQVVRNSERLTVLIFCDGETEINLTPFDAGINEVFQEKQATQKKARQPFIITLRSQRGEYVGCTVSLPPALLNLPAFPPLPLPIPAEPKPINAPPPAPTVQAPSLIIIGTKVSTSLPPSPTNVLTSIAPTTQTNRVPVPSKISTMTNTVVRTNAMAPTNSVSLPKNSGGGRNPALVVGVILLAVAGALTVLILRARRTNRSSLITRSMNDK